MSGAGIYIKTDSGLVAAATVPGKQGSQGPQSSLVPGTVTTGAAGTSAAATITGAGPVQTLNLTIPKGDPGGFVEASILPEADLDTLTTPGMYYRGSSITPPANWPATGFAGWIEVLNYPTGVWPLGTVQRATSVRSTAGIGASYQTTYWRSRFSTEGWGPWLQGTFVGRPGGADLTGTGSPEGVVTAPVGTYYTDTALTNGAMRWAKKTGIGNTGWKVTHGDTGWRNVTASLSGIDAANTGTLSLRRIGVTVTWRFSNLLLSAGSGTLSLWAAIPTGFRGAAMVSLAVQRNNSQAYVNRIGLNVTGLGWLGEEPIGAVSTSTRPAIGLTGLTAPHATDDAWPTALPGTAA